MSLPMDLWRYGPRTCLLGVVRDGAFLPLHRADSTDLKRHPRILLELPKDSTDEKDRELIEEALKGLIGRGTACEEAHTSTKGSAS